jgi:hypothetical protein
MTLIIIVKPDSQPSIQKFFLPLTLLGDYTCEDVGCCLG